MGQSILHDSSAIQGLLLFSISFWFLVYMGWKDSRKNKGNNKV